MQHLTIATFKRYKATAPTLFEYRRLVLIRAYRRLVMKSLYKLVSQLLIVSMVLVPFATQAGMIGTDQVVANAAAQANRDKVVQFVSRGDVAKQLEALGVKSTEAQARVAAMTQEEINAVAGKIDTLPAGADDSAWWWAAGIIIVALIVWYAYK
jgi:hypothetical protein